MKEQFVAVMTTVNAPHHIQLDTVELAACLKDISDAKKFVGHVWCFLGEVPVHDQVEFAAAHGIDKAELVATAHAFSSLSGASFPLAAAA